MPEIKTPEELEKEETARLEKEAQDKEQQDRDEKAAEAAEIERKQLEEEKAAEVEAERLKHEGAKPKKESADSATGVESKLYNADEVKAMMEEVARKVAERFGASAAPEDNIDKPMRHTLRLARYQNKYVIGFENVNDDEFAPNRVIHAFNVYNADRKTDVAWIKVIFDDGSVKPVPLERLVEDAHPVECEILEDMPTDTSYSIGKVERTEIKDYHPEGTGVMINQVVKQASHKYKVRTPQGTEYIVGSEVINFR